ncbi:MAG: hypothetical protein LBD41_06940 [Clostridiales Family XIII bacterium]|jgi:hypothetical protein|nr:hypothetical protein [Clostridiales Family XIII bacterium]
MKYFDAGLFLINYRKKHKTIETIETKDISDFLEVSVRYIQKWAKNNELEYKRIHGRKYYVWDEMDFYRLEDWIEENNEKKQPEPVIKKWSIIQREVKKKIKKEHKVNFRTIKDLSIELYGHKDESAILSFRKWAKIFDVAFQYHFGRKYYIISDEIKEIFSELINNKEFHNEVFPKIKVDNKKYHTKNTSNLISYRDLDNLIKIAKEQEKYQRTK